MTITKRVVLSQVEVVAVGHVQVRLSKEVVEDGTVLSSEYHRTAIECGAHVGAQMLLVNAHLGEMGWPPVSAAECARVAAIAAADWTPERLSAWEAFKLAEERKKAPKGT